MTGYRKERASIQTLLICGLIAMSTLLCACSNRQIYDAAQNNRRQECDKLPDSAQRDACLEQYSQSYDDYQREREEILKRQEHP